MADADARGERAARASASLALMPASRQGSAMLSPRVSVGSRLKNWNTKPIRSRRTRVSSSSPSATRSRSSSASGPAEGRSIAPQRCSSVDLPQPDGPISATKSPALDGERHACRAPDRCAAARIGLGEVGRDQERHSYSMTPPADLAVSRGKAKGRRQKAEGRRQKAEIELVPLPWVAGPASAYCHNHRFGVIASEFELAIGLLISSAWRSRSTSVSGRFSLRARSFERSYSNAPWNHQRGGSGRRRSRQGRQWALTWKRPTPRRACTDFISLNRGALREAREALFWLRLIVATSCETTSGCRPWRKRPISSSGSCPLLSNGRRSDSRSDLLPFAFCLLPSAFCLLP